MTMTTVDPFAVPSLGLLAPSSPSPAPATPSGTEPTTEPTTEPGKGPRARGLATGGRNVSLGDSTQPPTWPASNSPDETYVPDETFDVSDLSNVNRLLNECRARLFRSSGQLRQAQRSVATADLAYRRAYRRALIGVSGGTAESRKAVAEVECEPLENDLVVSGQIAEEWKKRCMDCRDDLKALENLSHNMRAQMAIS